MCARRDHVRDFSGTDGKRAGKIGGKGPDITPIIGAFKGIQRTSRPQRRRKYILPEIRRTVLGNGFEKGAAQTVNTRVDGIGQRFRRTRFFRERCDFTVVVGIDNAERARIGNGNTQKRCIGIFCFVGCRECGEIAGEYRISADDECIGVIGIGIQIPCIPYASGCSARGICFVCVV